MHCPKCERAEYDAAAPCPGCGFSGDPTLIEALSHVDWVLDEIDTWEVPGLRDTVRDRLRELYVARQRALEIALDLRLAPFTEAQAREAWPRLFQLEALRARIGRWLAADLLTPGDAQEFLRPVLGEMEDLTEQLEGHARPVRPSDDTFRLQVAATLLTAVDRLEREHRFTAPQAAAEVRATLEQSREHLETRLGLRPARVHEATAPVGASEHEAAPAGVPEPAGAQEEALPAAPSPPPAPFRDRLWRTLASERTLRAMLFLGIFLLFAAAISFVVWGWRDFAPVVRVAIPTGFTALFFLLGWYVRVRMGLYRSSIALSAIASLLIPIDFYTAFVSLDVPARYWPEFWLLTSACCLVAYLVVTLNIGNVLFGYLVGAAAGSIMLAAIEVAHKSAGLSRDWYTAGLSALAAAMVVLGTAIARRASGRWRIMADPLRYLALLAVGVLMPLTFGWRFVERETYDALHTALTVNWWLGGLVFAWGAVHHRSRGLGVLAALALPVSVYLAQAAAFHHTGTNPAWHAFGWACLVPLYLIAGRRLSAREDPVIHGHGRTATGWGVALTIAAALWSLTDLTSGAASASSHAILTGGVVLGAVLWRRPRSLYAASLLSFTAASFAMAEMGLDLAQLCIGWASLSIVHAVVALNVGRRTGTRVFAPPLVAGGYAIAALALLPPLFPYNGDLVVYTLGNWIALAAWAARLAHTGQPGFAWQRAGEKDALTRSRLWWHWLAALPLPIWLWAAFLNRRAPDASFSLALAVLSWGLVALSRRLARTDAVYRRPWYWTGLAVSVAAPVAAFVVAPGGFAPALCLLSAGLLWFADALSGRQRIELLPAGLVTGWGCLLALDGLGVSFDALTFSLALLVSLYLAGGMWTERRRSKVFTAHFLQPLALAAHLLALTTVGFVWLGFVRVAVSTEAWSDTARLWASAALVLLGVAYGFYAWARAQERWGHAAAWLGTVGGGILFTVYSRGRGSSAAKVALLAVIFVLAERTLRWLWQHERLARRRRAFFRLAWHLYKRPCLVAGWTVSVGAIILALIRNLLLLEGGQVQQTWAAAGLLLVSGLYALSARLFRRARFAWFASLLVVAPWTILNNLGWYTALRPTLPGAAVGWAVLAWALFCAALLIRRLGLRQEPPEATWQAYALPPRLVAHALLPFALLWGVADVDTSRVTFGLAVALYGLAAWLDGRLYARGEPNAARSALGAAKHRYPALVLIPVWCTYLMAWLLPAARHEHYGLMILAFGPLGLAAGRWLLPALQARGGGTEDQAAGRLPGYLVGYGSLIVGTMLVAHVAPLLALALLFDSALMLASARLFRNPLWAYPAAAMVPLSLLIALHEAGVDAERHGWALIGLAALYLALAWLLRRAKLRAYGTSALTAGLALIALGLPPSSQDQVGALWGYGSAALLYAICAGWLRQPLFLTLASVLSIVPYAVVLQRSALAPAYYGLALLPGALVALGLGWALDARFGRKRDFFWARPARWFVAVAERLLNWWGLPLHALGFGLAAASPFFVDGRAGVAALNWALLALVCGWGLYRFRLRGWLLAVGLAVHLAALAGLDALGWWAYPPWAWLRFLPVTAVTLGVALAIERRRGEGSPLDLGRMLVGWSRPLTLLALVDVLAAQVLSLSKTGAGAAVTVVHALLAAVLASVWQAPVLATLCAALGATALWQWLAALAWPALDVPVGFAWLAVGYGTVGYGLAMVRRYLLPGPDSRVPRGLRAIVAADAGQAPAMRRWVAVWERPLQRSSLVLSWGVVLFAGWLGLDLVGWTVRAMLGFPFREIVDQGTVTMAVGVLSWLGLLYVAAAVVYRRLRLSYLAVGMLLAGWMLYAFYIQAWAGLARVQWYAIPAGLYLLGIGYLEWERGSRRLGRWLDYAAMLLMVGSLFWQTLRFGWQFALLLGVEGFLSLWWGSARRLRRFFYAGMVGVILATLAQLINSLQSINQWVVFGTIGLLLVAAAAIVERKLEDIRASLEEVLEDWE